LSNCARLDECKDWADKAAALASYARQAEDDQLEKMAIRIRGRAVRRTGELLKEIEPSKGGRPSETRGDASPSLTRKQAAIDAGLSSDQMKDALRVSNIPADDFERQVDSENPPPISALAEQGTKKKARPILDLNGRDPGEFNRAMHFAGDIRQAMKLLEELNINRDLPILTASECCDVRSLVTRIDAITDQIMTRIKK
jgi:hypothetical protein